MVLQPGDLLVAFSDGVTEALSATGEEYGEDRLLECVGTNRQKSMREILDAIFASVREFSVGAVQSDDVTALVVRFDGPR
jgi:sigma-B regulation protein RsbU (phosphoserine phosphatase)